MEYTCLKNLHKGFIVTRKPERIKKELIISFSGSPPNAHAIFENEKGESMYRLLKDESCSIPAYFLAGEIKVAVAVLDGKNDAEKCFCEPFFAEEMGEILIVYPNWLDIPMQVVSVYEALNGVKDDMKSLANECVTLNEKVDKVLDGVDFD